MGAILSFVSAGAFKPNDIEAMSVAYDDVCNVMRINGDICTRETSWRVIELARRGERCPAILRDQVMAGANGGTRC